MCGQVGIGWSGPDEEDPVESAVDSERLNEPSGGCVVVPGPDPEAALPLIKKDGRSKHCGMEMGDPQFGVDQQVRPVAYQHGRKARISAQALQERERPVSPLEVGQA